MTYGKIRVLGIFGIFLILLSIGFAALPLMPNSTLDLIRTIARQRTLDEQITKDALILAYRPTAEHVQAINELQSSLPVFEGVNAGLENGDQSLGISSNLPPEIQASLLQAQPDFVSIDTSARKILAHPSPVDQTQLSILLQHERPYSITMYQMSDLFEAHIVFISRIYFSIGTCIVATLMIIWIIFFKAVMQATSKPDDAN